MARTDGLKVSVEINAPDRFFFSCFFNDFLSVCRRVRR